MSQAAVATAIAPAAAAENATGLDGLAAMDAAALEGLYRSARTPAVAEVVGDLEGRMLAVIKAGPLHGMLRAVAAWRGFPWKGKSFEAKSADRGQGINRVFGDEQRDKKGKYWFRFETYLAPSRAGDGDAFQLDYDNPGNPF